MENSSRIIKFRAWEHNSESMWEWWKLGGFAQGGVWRDFEDIYTNPHRYELMQFTGLTDKNGKDVYEGDIVDESDRKYVVEMPDVYQTNYGDGLYEQKAVVIGNIWENPELI